MENRTFQQSAKEISKIAIKLARIASKELPKLDKEELQIVDGTFAKKFEELNRKKQ